MTKYSLGALVAAGVLAGGFATSASAADLGGNCCADLEERIAELEATTARKGNRKVSLTVSGWVGQQVMFWDDGEESNVYVHDLGATLASHVKFTGQATISPGYTAGYVIHIETIGSDGLTHGQGGPGSSGNVNGPHVYSSLNGRTGFGGVDVVQSYWFIKSDQMGKIGVGLQSQASDNTAMLVDGSGSLVPANWVAFDTRLMGLRHNNGTLVAGETWGLAQSCNGMGGVWGDCNGLTHNVVRYDSPTFAGFSVSASWGEDDMWDIAGRYSGEHHGVKIAIAAAYNEVTDSNYNNLTNALGAVLPDQQYFQIGGYLEHVQTGLFALVNYGHLDIDGVNDAQETWYVKAGIRQRWNHLGHTVLYGEYLNGQDGGFGANSELDVWGLGVVQEIDAAAMSMWLKYRNLSYEDDFHQGAVNGIQDFNYIGLGALINF